MVDDDPFSLTRGGALEDTSLVSKYRMSEEDYDKRQGTLRCVRMCMCVCVFIFIFFIGQFHFPARQLTELIA